MKLDIKRKVLLLVLSGSLLTFLVVTVFSVIGLYEARKTLSEETDELSVSASHYAEDLVEKQIKKNMEEITRTRAQNMNRIVTEASEDARYLANEMNSLLKKGVRLADGPLPNALYEDVPDNKPYIHYSPKLVQQGISPAVQKEIDLESGIADSFLRMNQYYPEVFLGSRTGYTIRTKKRGKPSFLSAEPYRSSYDAREREWYKLGKAADGPVFTDVYLDTETKNPCVSCVVSYHNGEGFAGVIGIDLDAKEIYDEMMATAVLGDNEQSVVVGRNGEIIASSQKDGVLSFSHDHRDLRQSGQPSFSHAVAEMVEGKTGIEVVSIDGIEYYLAYAPIKLTGWSFGTLIEKEVSLLPAREAASGIREWTEDFKEEMRGNLAVYGMTMAVVLGLLLAGGVAFSTWAARRFVRPLLELQDGVKQIARGELDRMLVVKTGDEIEELADSVNNMSARLKTYIEDLSKVTAEKERIATELSVAKNIQEGMLPKIFPPFPGIKEFDIYASMHAAKEVGGDFYDFYLVDEDHLAVTIGDVSGKGIPAALFMVVAKTVLKNYMLLLKKPETLGEVMAKANDQLVQNNEESMFVTVFMGLLDIRTGEFSYANAGHNRPLLRQGADSGFEWLPKADACMMGLMDGMDFPVRRLQLAPGDCLFLYTDGVTEAMDEEDRLFSDNQLETVLASVPRNAEAQDILTLVSQKVKAHAGNAEQSDDVTMLGLLYKG